MSILYNVLQFYLTINLCSIKLKIHPLCLDLLVLDKNEYSDTGMH